MPSGASYCGAPPVPGALADRFNLDPVLAVALLLAASFHAVRSTGGAKRRALAGWAAAGAALLSPLCALSVALFSARVGQHMLLMLAAAPLIASALPTGRPRASLLWLATLLYAVLLWFWHMPAPYAATFASTPVYWSMHLSLFGSAVLLWHALLGHDAAGVPRVLAAGTITSIQMGLLGAVLTLAGRPLFAPHYLTTMTWGLTPLADQQLGGLLMWVPGCFFFLWAALRSLSLVWRRLEPTSA